MAAAWRQSNGVCGDPAQRARFVLETCCGNWCLLVVVGSASGFCVPYGVGCGGRHRIVGWCRVMMQHQV